MLLHDALTLDARRRSGDGYMAVKARSARAGVYDYLGSEVDPQGAKFKATDIVKVYRPAEEVFKAASLASFVAKPITDNHPNTPVTSANWRDHARGTVFGAVKDGDYVTFDLAFMDAALIDAVDSGKRELSNGYACDLAFEDGTAPDGTAYHAVQRNIRGNHVAVVDRGRAGSECRVADASAFALCDSNPSILDRFTKEKPVKTMLIDGLTVDVSNADTAIATINTILAARDAALGKVTGLETQVATLTTDKATLETENKQLKDSKPTTAQLLDAAKAYGQVVGKAKALGVTVTDAMDQAAVMKAVVDAKMGDAAKDWNDEQIAASFAVLTKDAKVEDQQVQSLGAPRIVTTNDNASVRDFARLARY
ncbi:DUF2213 domain-containing protein [Sphingomonas soli]|uniref:DUF2213 domain-containing protein n=1 Tax=Sphingomonas soli TaxID=266127 RepID=UPI00082DD54A|nr:DUF2213 domain-containing protein [Sphingomonas soli]